MVKRGTAVSYVVCSYVVPERVPRAVYYSVQVLANDYTAPAPPPRARARRPKCSSGWFLIAFLQLARRRPAGVRPSTAPGYVDVRSNEHDRLRVIHVAGFALQ